MQIFSIIISVLSTKRPKLKCLCKNYTDYLTHKNLNSFFPSPTDKEEIKMILSSLDNSKATGPYRIPTKASKLLKNDISDQYASIFNFHFTMGSFPTLLKTAKLIPIHKKESKLDYTNHQSISLLSNLDKISKRLTHNRLYKFLMIITLFILSNLAFDKNILIHLTKTIKEALDLGKKYACGIFVDLQKVFDTVDYNILMGKLKYYSIRGVAYSWFESYLKGRKKYISINGFNSQDLPISQCVPQGSVFGSLLFVLYIKVLPTAIKFCKVHHFADDTNLLHISNSILKLNKFVNFDLKTLSNWLNANKISLNASKAELMFIPKMTKLDFDLKLTLNGKRLYPTKSVKYDGIEIDERLTWNEYINDITIKLNQANVKLYKVRESVNIRVVKLIYNATIDCHLNYANTLWGQNKNSLNGLFLSQKALRTIGFECRNAH